MANLIFSIANKSAHKSLYAIQSFYYFLVYFLYFAFFISIFNKAFNITFDRYNNTVN